MLLSPPEQFDWKIFDKCTSALAISIHALVAFQKAILIHPVLHISKLYNKYSNTYNSELSAFVEPALWPMWDEDHVSCEFQASATHRAPLTERTNFACFCIRRRKIHSRWSAADSQSCVKYEESPKLNLTSKALTARCGDNELQQFPPTKFQTFFELAASVELLIDLVPVI